jgi:hypothetical protein
MQIKQTSENEDVWIYYTKSAFYILKYIVNQIF